MLGTVDSRTGAFRKGNVTAGASYFSNFDEVEQLTTQLATYIMVPADSLDEATKMAMQCPVLNGENTVLK